ncbi:hypothetical protein BTJ49_02475 [Oleiagrimonas sp. MCCC 1A03011]|nr:hypothetical protein BTJ49_02475 [Oleiagrimonas sp. MCCC 1A03011]
MCEAWSKSMKYKGVLMLALLAGLIGPARAAQGSCTGRTLPVQRMFCESPALQRMEMAIQDLERTHVDAGAARDASVWRADRDDALWTAMRYGFSGREVRKRAWALERARMDELLSRRGLGAGLDEPLTALVRVLRAADVSVDVDLASVWRASDASVHTARVVAGDNPAAVPSPEGVFRSLQVHPTPALTEQVRQWASGSPNLTLHWLASARIGAVESVQGSADCAYRAWFRVDADGVAHVLPAPMLDQAPCIGAGERITLVRAGHDTYVMLQRRVDADTVDVSTQWWAGQRWASPQRVRLRFDHALHVDALRCAVRDCGPYRKAVARLAARYDRSPQAGQLPVPKIEKVVMQRMLRMARRTAAAHPEAGTNRLPFGQDLAWNRFCDEATYFYVRVNGQRLLGRIGHGHRGWRTDDGWLVGLWAERDGRLQPVAGAVVRRARGRLLSVSAMPPAIMPTR